MLHQYSTNQTSQMQHFESEHTFPLGQTVRYFSTDLGDWVTADIHSYNIDGTMNLTNRRVEAKHVVVRTPQVCARL